MGYPTNLFQTHTFRNLIMPTSGGVQVQPVGIAVNTSSPLFTPWLEPGLTVV
jgi:hypothetical protein